MATPWDIQKHASPPDPPTRGFAPGPCWGLRPRSSSVPPAPNLPLHHWRQGSVRLRINCIHQRHDICHEPSAAKEKRYLIGPHSFIKNFIIVCLTASQPSCRHARLAIIDGVTDMT